jgi:hypothetical protein
MCYEPFGALIRFNPMLQQLAGHSSFSMTQHYIEGDSDAKRKLVHFV